MLTTIKTGVKLTRTAASTKPVRYAAASIRLCKGKEVHKEDLGSYKPSEQLLSFTCTDSLLVTITEKQQQQQQIRKSRISKNQIWVTLVFYFYFNKADHCSKTQSNQI